MIWKDLQVPEKTIRMREGCSWKVGLHRWEVRWKIFLLSHDTNILYYSHFTMSLESTCGWGKHTYAIRKKIMSLIAQIALLWKLHLKQLTKGKSFLGWVRRWTPGLGVLSLLQWTGCRPTCDTEQCGLLRRRSGNHGQGLCSHVRQPAFLCSCKELC